MNIILVDLSHLLYRSWHTFGAFQTTTGIPTGMPFGVTRAIEHLKKEYPNYSIFFVEDGYPESKFSLRPDYKSGRESNAEIHSPSNRAYVNRIILASGCALVYDELLECDDVIGQIVAKDNFKECIIYSGDDDFCQLVGEKVRLWKPKVGKNLEHILYEEGVTQIWGVPPKSLALFRSIVGDSSDRISGIPRIPKDHLADVINSLSLETPKDFLEKNAIALFPPKWKMALEAFQPTMEQNYLLTKLPWKNLAFKAIVRTEKQVSSMEVLEGIFKELEFSSFLKKLGAYKELVSKAPAIAL